MTAQRAQARAAPNPPGDTKIIYHFHEEDGPFPWTFDVAHKGKTFYFRGIPNRCATKREAAARAGWRAKWLREGTFDQHYKVAGK